VFNVTIQNILTTRLKSVDSAIKISFMTLNDSNANPVLKKNLGLTDNYAHNAWTARTLIRQLGSV
jgi:hypothetical protein